MGSGGHDWWSTEGVCKRQRINKGKMVLVDILVPERAAPPAITLNPDNSVPPYMSLVLFELPSLLWSLRQVFWASESICRPFKRISESATALHLIHKNPLWFSQPAVVMTSLSSTRTLGLGPRYGARTACSSGVPVQPRYPSWFWTSMCGCATSPFHVSVLLSVSTWLLYSLSDRSLIQLVSKGFSMSDSQG